ncbi:MAG: hypothetical protein A3J74_10335 [Elusimicrobia bacterium RIFCSPHIGHO2_02_FULL_57_9]|nr:MAG: hypothetical protein A3J74_10335 [Elusimicrobia bacterium RIFCSPHIGHO2_02_FULL_57_9]
MNLFWFLGLFFISGFCSLVYETIWLRMAMGVFGVTAPFVSIFISVFMAGLGLGSWAGGRLAQRLRSKPASTTLRLYALAELVIAVSAVAVPILLALSKELLADALAGVDWGSSGYYWVSGLFVTLALLPWCMCMGATFPLAMASIEKRFTRSCAGSFSYLYLANVIGAACGTLVCAFVLIELFGLRASAVLAAVLNVIIALLAFILSLERSMGAALTSAESSPAGPHAAGPRLLSLLFMTGLVSMAMEVVWIRQFTPFLGTTIYAFAIILALYLAASFAGSCLYRAALRRGAASDHFAWIISGALGLLPLAAANPYLPFNGPLRVLVGIAALCGLMGYLTPSLVDRWSSGDPHRAGTAYAVNILGCILGPLLAGFLLLPHMAERHALAVLSLPLFAVGFLSVRSLGPRRFFGAINAATFYAALAVLASAQVFLSVSFEDRLGELGWKTEVKRDYQATVVAAGTGMQRMLLVNGAGMTKLTPITKFMAHLPLAFLPRPPQNALVICFGMGTTFRSLLSWGIEVTAVELVAGVYGVFGYFHSDAQEVLASPRARIVVDDGRRFLARSPEQFDVITIDAAPPMESAGTSFLYTKEFYSLIAARLKPSGIVQQWFMEPLEPSVMSAFASALKESFPYVRVFLSVEGWGYHCLASRSPIAAYSAAALVARMPPAAARDFLEFGPHARMAEQMEAAISKEIAIDDLIISGVRPLRDDHPINEYFFLRREFPKLWP